MRLAQVGGVLFFASALGGCILPIPTLERRGPAEGTIRAIEPGATTRAEIRLWLGDPQGRSTDDAHFTYLWVESHAGVEPVVILGQGGFPLPAVSEVSCHSLAIQFGPDGVVLRIKKFDGKTSTEWGTEQKPAQRICASDHELLKRVQDWIAEAASPP